MKIWAILTVRNEADIISYTLAHLLSQGIDGMILCDHGSTDNTLEILTDTPKAIVITEWEPVFKQSEMMTSLAHLASQEGADWVICCDADELYWVKDGTIAEAIKALPKDTSAIAIGFHEYAPTGKDDPNEPNPFKRMTWRYEQPGKLTKIAFKYQPGVIIAEGSHAVQWTKSHKMDSGKPTNSIHMAHFPYRTADQFVSKVVNSGRRIEGLPRGTSAHIAAFRKIHESAGEDGLRKFFAANLYHQDPENDGLICDPAPYTEKE